MGKHRRKIFALAMGVIAVGSSAQTPTGADFIKAINKADVNVTFDVNSEGEPFYVKWGMDTAWDWDFNVYKGIAHNRLGNFETGRISFQPNDLVKDNGDGTYTLSARQIKALDSRIKHIKLTGTKEVNINCDHEMLFKNGDKDDYTGRDNYQGKPEEWYKLIKATVQYTQKQGLKVVSVSPFNESDFVGWMQYKGDEANGMKDFLAIAKLIKADDFFKDIRVCGGNTLNCDRAMPWYNYLKDYLDEGNTHQLAGEFDTYADFFTQVKADGKVATGDELHNVGEAIVGANYGMETGIWWGFDSRTRGQFMIDSNEGVRLGYGENRNAWTDAAVYRNDRTGEVHGYFGSSERQAKNSSFAYISTTKDVYFNGYGPTRMFTYDVPGGTGYQNGQIGAERMFDITWGEDVAPGVIDGTYMIMNAYSKKMLSMNGSNDLKSNSKTSSGTTQQWHVYPIQVNGDISYWAMDNAGNTKNHINAVLDWGNLENIFTKSGRVITYTNDGRPDEEQWYLKYAKDGYYYIINRLTGLYMFCSSNTAGAIVSLKTAPADNETESNLKKYMWRFQPTDSKADTKAPDTPLITNIRQRAGSIQLTWSAPADTDPLTYNIIRGETLGDAQVFEYNTIGRNISGNTFIDNTAIAGSYYLYKVVAVDYAGNRSEASSECIGGKRLNEKALICQLQFDSSLKDNSANHMDMSYSGTDKYATVGNTKKSGEAALSADGTSYGMLPHSVADNEEMTIAFWAKGSSSTSSWQRIFDFGNNEQQYMFFTPNNGKEMSFVMKNGGDEQILTCGQKLSSLAYKHITITLKPIDGSKVHAIVYLDGNIVAESSEFTIKPSDIKPSLCFIGRSMYNADPLFKGYIDDFRIYNYALTKDEVANVMTDLDAVSKDIKDSYEDVATSIKDIRNERSNSATYDLNGRKVKNASHGIYIHEGKKVKV